MRENPRGHLYRIEFDSDHGRPDQVEFYAQDVAGAFFRLEQMKTKRAAVILENGRMIAELTYFDGYWRVN